MYYFFLLSFKVQGTPMEHRTNLTWWSLVCVSKVGLEVLLYFMFSTINLLKI
jgi:hypothetical protein